MKIIKKHKKISRLISVYILLAFYSFAFGATHISEVYEENSKIRLFTSPRTATFEEGSVFELPIYINTNGKSVNTIDLKLSFDPSKLSIVEKSGNTSIIGIWIDAPEYSNTIGFIELAGSIPNGIVTESGLVIRLKFKALAPGETSLLFSPETKVYLNDGSGTRAEISFDRSSFTILPKAPAGLSIYSDTHPFQDKWYNNNSPVLGWDAPSGSSVFSFVLDDKPFTVPSNISGTTTNHVSFDWVSDGVMYVQLKAQRNGLWGETTNFLLRMDTTPPREFKPKIEVLSATIINKTLVFFETTDSLSGIDHYEVGVLDKLKLDSSPLFVVAHSPYELPSNISGSLRVIVRAFDKAGNVRDGSIDVTLSSNFLKFIFDNILLVILILIMITHFLFRHKVVHHISRILNFTKKEFENDDENKPDNNT